MYVYITFIYLICLFRRDSVSEFIRV